MQRLGTWSLYWQGKVRNQDRTLITAKLFYLSFFAAIGALAPFLNIFFQQRGLSGTEIGLLGSVAPLVALAANPFWGAIADRFHVHKQVLAACVLLAGLLSVPFVFLTGFWPILLLMVAMFFFRAPVPALLDTAVMGMLARSGAAYGRQRLFGSIGFLLASYGLGQVMATDNLSPIFWMHGALLAVGCTILSLQLPFPRRQEEETQAPGMWRGLRLLAGQRSYTALLIMNVFVGFGAACFTNFVGLRLLGLGGTNGQVGLAFALNALAEIPVMYMGGRLSLRFGKVKLLLGGLVGLASVYALAGLAPTPLLMLAAMSTLGLFNGAYWMNLVVFASEHAPVHLRATGLALVGAAQGGLGWALGGVTGGVLWDAFGGTVVLLTGAASLLIGAGIFLLGQRSGRSEKAPLRAPVDDALRAGAIVEEEMVGEVLR